jgi:hypothetical protein
VLLTGQTIGAATANANNRNGFAGNRSDCSEAAQLMRVDVEVVSAESVGMAQNVPATPKAPRAVRRDAINRHTDVEFQAPASQFQNIFCT